MKKILLMAVVVAAGLVGCNSNKSTNVSEAQSGEMPAMAADSSNAANLKHAMLGVEGNCDQCKATIEKAALSVKGVSTANWEKEKKVLHLNFDPQATSLEEISKAVAKAGYDTDKDKAAQADYDALPPCCKYRK